MMNMELKGFFDREKMLNLSPASTSSLDKAQMAQILDEYRDKIFPHSQLADFLPPHELTQDDIQRLMELTGKIKQGEKAYEPFAEYLKQRKLYEDRFGEWQVRKNRNQASLGAFKKQR